MKRITNKAVFAALALLAVILICACAKPTAKDSGELDTAIREAVDYLNDTLPKERMILIINVQSDSVQLSDYIIEKLYANIRENLWFYTVSLRQRDFVEINEVYHVTWNGEMPDDVALELGNIYKVDTVITGKVSTVSGRYRLTIRALDVQTGNVQGTYSYIFTAKKLMNGEK